MMTFLSPPTLSEKKRESSETTWLYKTLSRLGESTAPVGVTSVFNSFPCLTPADSLTKLYVNHIHQSILEKDWCVANKLRSELFGILGSAGPMDISLHKIEAVTEIATFDQDKREQRARINEILGERPMRKPTWSPCESGWVVECGQGCRPPPKPPDPWSKARLTSHDSKSFPVALKEASDSISRSRTEQSLRSMSVPGSKTFVRSDLMTAHTKKCSSTPKPRMWTPVGTKFHSGCHGD